MTRWPAITGSGAVVAIFLLGLVLPSACADRTGGDQWFGYGQPSVDDDGGDDDIGDDDGGDDDVGDDDVGDDDVGDDDVGDDDVEDDDVGDDDVGDDDVGDDDVGDDDVGDDDVGDDDTAGTDADGDGWTVEAGDCDDTDPTVNPGAPELCGGGDENCDGSVDEPGAQGCTNYYADADADGFGDPATISCLCAPAPPLDMTVGGDCYDASADAYPGQTAFSDQDRGDGSFDYNCDNIEEPEFADLYDCPNGQCVIITQGWVNGVAACGVTADWGTDCYGTGGCIDITEPRTQNCR